MPAQSKWRSLARPWFLSFQTWLPIGSPPSLRQRARPRWETDESSSPSTLPDAFGWHHLLYVNTALPHYGCVFNLNMFFFFFLLLLVISRYLPGESPPSWLEVNYSHIGLMHFDSSSCKWTVRLMSNQEWARVCVCMYDISMQSPYFRVGAANGRDISVVIWHHSIWRRNISRQFDSN